MAVSKCADLAADWWPYVASSGAVLATILVIRSRSRRRSVESWPKDTVVLHQYKFGRGPWAPNLSNYPIKLETFLRGAKIPYVNNFTDQMSKEGKTPWITYNGEDVADSEFCIEYLNQKIGVDLNQHLSDEEKAVARAFQRLVEDNMYWCWFTERYHYDTTFISGVFRQLRVSWVFKNMWLGYLLKQSRAQGTGRHTHKEVIHIADINMKSLSDFLGNKPYLMGDEPCEQDMAIFGLLANLIWHTHDTSPIGILTRETYPNLRCYCTRMQERFWPDWDECITHGFTKQATK